MQGIYAEMTGEVIVLWIFALARFPEEVAVEAIGRLITEPAADEDGRLVKPEPQMAVRICREIQRERATTRMYDQDCQLCSGSGWKQTPEQRVTRCSCGTRVLVSEANQPRALQPPIDAEPFDIEGVIKQLGEKCDISGRDKGQARPETREMSEQQEDERWQRRQEELKRQAQSLLGSEPNQPAVIAAEGLRDSSTSHPKGL